jgi:hypothetical protein
MYKNIFYIEIFILTFMFTVISLCISFSVYYISPSNYVLYDFDSSAKNTLTKEYSIEPNKQKKIFYSKYPNKVFRILSNELDCVPIIIENRFKSENIYVNKNKLIKLVNGNLIIKNTTEQLLKVTIELYSTPKMK